MNPNIGMKIIYALIIATLFIGSSSGQRANREALIHQFTEAAGAGDLTQVRSLLANLGDPNVEPKSHKGWTPLMAAVTSGRGAVVEYLIANGASLDVTLDDGRTVLIQAAQSNNYHQTLQALLNAGVKVNVQTKDGLSALMRFAWMGHRDGVRLLLAAGADPTLKNKNGWTAFYFACSHGNDREIVELLLKSGADPNERRPDGSTPLMWEGWGNRAKNFEVLIPAGADLNAKAKDGRTPLMISSSRLFVDEVSLLLKSEADPNAKDSRGWTALMFAAASKFRSGEVGAHGDGMVVWLSATDLIEKLAESGASLDETNEDGDTALILAEKNANFHFAERLLRLGANPSIRNKKGRTASDYRNEFGKDRPERLLRLAADVEARRRTGQD